MGDSGFRIGNARTFVDVRRVCLLSGLCTLLLLTASSGSLLSGFLEIRDRIRLPISNGVRARSRQKWKGRNEGKKLKGLKTKIVLNENRANGRERTFFSGAFPAGAFPAVVGFFSAAFGGIFFGIRMRLVWFEGI